MKSNKQIKLFYLGVDKKSTPVYKDEQGNLYKDADPRCHVPPALFRAANNEYDGELIYPQFIYNNIKFIPSRKAW